MLARHLLLLYSLLFNVSMDLLKDVSTLFGVGAAQSKKLSRLGITTIKDLIYHFPRTYRDLSQPQKISDLRANEEGIIEARVLDIAAQRTFRRRMVITTALVEDESGTLSLVWFNQTFLTRVLRQGETFIFYGKLIHDRGATRSYRSKVNLFDRQVANIPPKPGEAKGEKTGSLQMQSPQYEKFPKIIPIYPETEGLTSKRIRLILSDVLSQAREIDDNLPPEIVKKYKLMPLGLALWNIHEPENQDQLNNARRRLAFDELFSVVAHFIKFEKDLSRHRAPNIGIDEARLKNFVSRLPYKLTDEQRMAAWRIIKGMSSTGSDNNYTLSKCNHASKGNYTLGVVPLNALLNGDVGSGKTVVALLASLNVISNGYNAVWLAPTQILARQHFETVSQLLSGTDIDIELITAATKITKYRCHPELACPSEAYGRRRVSGSRSRIGVRDDNRAGSIIIGTHALLHRRHQLRNIGLVVVDEQHRFGVEQRRALLSNDAETKLAPHFLSMTATPIPRSLAMMLSGMTELITIKEKPTGRKRIITKVVDGAARQSMYRAIEEQIARGRQVYVIAPLIEESDKPRKTLFSDEKKAAAREAENLKKVFPLRKIGLLHGKMKSVEKDKIMKQMLARTLDILVSTTVVEVGVDIPNATVMVVENANYFGLAQLHQLRGRVGRSNHQSYCYLSIGDDIGKVARERLRIMEQTGDGFIIAQKDLELRGPGSLAGLDQSGFFDFKLANLADTKLLQQAKEAAEEVYNINKSKIKS